MATEAFLLAAACWSRSCHGQEGDLSADYFYIASRRVSFAAVRKSASLCCAFKVQSGKFSISMGQNETQAKSANAAQAVQKFRKSSFDL